MDNWILKGTKNLVNEHSTVAIKSPTDVKVKISHVLLSFFDEMVYSGEIETEYPRVLGHTAIGIVTEAGEACYGLEKGTRVFLKPARECGECLACRSGKGKDCEHVALAGRDFDGFMRDFAVCNYSDVTVIPDAVDDMHALCIETVGIAENIYDKLSLKPGQRVAIVGADITGIIIAQVMLYHKVVPIIVDNSPDNFERAKKCGIFYAFVAEDNLDENVKAATGGAMCDAAVYCASSTLPVSLATRLVSDGKSLVLCMVTSSDESLDVRDIISKNLHVYGVQDSFGYVGAAINMMVMDNINIAPFEKEVRTDFNPAKIFENRENFTNLKRKSVMQIMKMII